MFVNFLFRVAFDDHVFSDIFSLKNWQFTKLNATITDDVCTSAINLLFVPFFSTLVFLYSQSNKESYYTFGTSMVLH